MGWSCCLGRAVDWGGERETWAPIVAFSLSLFHLRGREALGIRPALPGLWSLPPIQALPLSVSAEGKGHKEKLELVACFSFFGNVMSMASVQLAGAKRDALLLSFKDAKVTPRWWGGTSCLSRMYHSGASPPGLHWGFGILKLPQFCRLGRGLQGRGEEHTVMGGLCGAMSLACLCQANAPAWC